ncbi:MAG: TIM barrel protein [Armatimonadota bacterium]
MKIGLHAFSFVLAAGLRDYQPVGRGALTASDMVEKAARLRCPAVQLAFRQVKEMDMVGLVNLGQQAKDLGVTLHLSTSTLEGEHLADMIRKAQYLSAPQVTVGMSRLKGTVQQRQHLLESLLRELDVAIKTAEKYKIVLAFENGRHTAAADLAAFIQAAQSEYVGVCFDPGNALTVPENPADSANILGPLAKSAHLKNWQVYRSLEGVMLVNCPVGDGVIDLIEVLRVLKVHQPNLLLFLQTAAERVPVPVLEDQFLREYPRITARALAALMRQGTLIYSPAELQFPHESKAPEKDVLKWEDDRLKRSLKQAQKLLGTESLTLSLG